MVDLDDMDDAPELDEAFFAEAKPMHGTLTVAQRTAFKMGRPKVETPKKQVTLRLDADVLDRFKATGPGWQTRINAALRASKTPVGGSGVGVGAAPRTQQRAMTAKSNKARA